MRGIKRKDSNKAREVKYIRAKKSFKSFLSYGVNGCWSFLVVAALVYFM